MAKADLTGALLDVIDTNLLKIGTLRVTVVALASLQAILDSARTVASTMPHVDV